MATGERHDGSRAAAFATGWLLVVWIGGTIGAVGVKVVSWLLGGVWPTTPLAGLLPDPAVRFVLELPRDALPGLVLSGVLRLDILTCLLVGPPLLLVPCLIVLLSGGSVAETWRLAAKPFRPAPKRPVLPAVHPDVRRKCGFSAAETTIDSTKRGPAGSGDRAVL